MIQKRFHFSDGTRIFYKEKDGRIQRFIEYSLTQKGIERKKYSTFIGNQNRPINAGKYYYLSLLSDIVSGFDDCKKNNYITI